MLFNYIKVAFRNIFRHKGYTLLNVVGLALGITCCLLILMWVMDELSYDQFHENKNRIYRVEQDQFYSGSVFHVNVTPYPMAEGLIAEIPEVKDASPYPYVGTLLLRYGEKVFFENNLRAVTASLLRMFFFPMIREEVETALEKPNSIVITEEIAEKYFGNEDALGKVITINNRFDFTVTGILKNLPTNTILQFDMLVPFIFLEDLGRTIDEWGWNSIVTFVQLHDQVILNEVEEKITELRYRKVLDLLQDDPEELEQFQQGRKTQFMLMPVVDIHLHSYGGYNRSMGEILYVYVVSAIALFVLLIACINFMNLSTARSGNRAKEVGLRKVVGAKKGNLVWQFYGESILLAFIGLFFSLLIIFFILPGFSTLAGKEFTFKTLLHWKFLVGMFSVTLLTGLIAGSYPALFLSAFQPVKILRGGLNIGAKGSLFRKVLVVVQFTLSISLIIGTSVIYKQLQFMKTKELGYDKEHLIYVPLRGDTRQSYEVLKHELLKENKVVNVTGTNFYPTNLSSNSSGGDWEGKDPNLNILISFGSVDFNYIETMGIELLEGRSFSKEFSTDTSTAFMVNEEVVRIMGVESVVNKRFSFMDIDGTIIGVMKNHHFQSVSENIEPLAIYSRPQNVNYIVVRLQSDDIQKGIDFVRSTWETIIPNYPFDYRFVDEVLDQMYQGWERLSTLLKYFAFLAILIACLGLFGLASFTAEQRTKEIGVRKVLGASVVNLMLLMSKEFTKWVLIANILAWPIAYFIMKNWLQSFAYRTSLAWWIFVLTGAVALVIALITVSYQSVRAALTNPVDALKYE